MNYLHNRFLYDVHYVIKFVSDLRQVGFSLVSSTNKTDCRDITEMLLKVVLKTS